MGYVNLKEFLTKKLTFFCMLCLEYCFYSLLILLLIYLLSTVVKLASQVRDVTLLDIIFC